MQIQEISIQKIKPDNFQPRKSFLPTRIKEMAQSIKTEGVINAIEIDKDFVIITGEIRWRAAKEAGLKIIPCKIIKKISKDERFMRQVIENIHHNTMTAWDTAKAMEKLLLLSAADSKDKAGSGGHNDKGISWLSNKLGNSRAAITSYLDILEANEPMQEAVKKGLSYTFVTELKRVEPKYKKELEKKVIKKNIRHRDGLRQIIGAVKQFPEKADELVKQNYSDCETVNETRDKIRKIVPHFTDTPVTDAFADSLLAPDELGRIIIQLNRWLKNNPASDIKKYHIRRVVTLLTVGKSNIERWQRYKDIKLPKIL